MSLSILTPKIEKLISIYTEGITNLGESLTLTFLFLEVRFKIVLHTGESVKRADLKSKFLFALRGPKCPKFQFENSQIMCIIFCNSKESNQA